MATLSAMDATSAIVQDETTDECNIETPTSRSLLLGFLITATISTLVLACTVAYMDNTNINTTNGLWKSLDVAKWVEWEEPKLDRANLIYHPTTALMVTMLSERVFGPTWKRMAYVNGIWGGVSLACLFVVMQLLGFGRIPSICAVLFQGTCGFFLTCSIMSEDIMGGIALMMLTVMMAVITSFRPTFWKIAMTALLFDLTWLFEWRLQVPMAPALLLTIAFYPGAIRQRLNWTGWFAGVSLGFAFLVATVLSLSAEFGAGIWHQDDIWNSFTTIVWPGKGLGTGWAGFSINKIWLMFAGVSQYWIGGLNIGSLHWLEGSGLLYQTIFSCVAIVVLLILFSRKIVINRANPGFQALGIMLGGNFLFAEFMNLYSQPQDPQMQMNAMAWLAFAWGFGCCLVLSTMARFDKMMLSKFRLQSSCHLSKGIRLLTILGLILLSFASVRPNWFGQHGLAKKRNYDSAALSAVAQYSNGIGDPRSAVSVFHGFEGLITWIAVEVDWTPQSKLEAAPQSSPRFKRMFLVDQATKFPNRKPADAADAVRTELEDYLNKGYCIFINQVWSYTEEEFVGSFSTVSSSDKPRAIYRTLKQHFTATPEFSVHGRGSFYRLQRKQQIAAKNERNGTRQ